MALALVTVLLPADSDSAVSVGLIICAVMSALTGFLSLTFRCTEKPRAVTIRGDFDWPVGPPVIH